MDSNNHKFKDIDPEELADQCYGNKELSREISYANAIFEKYLIK